MPKAVPLRVILELQGKEHKFISLYAGKDNSFYFHPYRPEGEPWFEPAPNSGHTPAGLRIHFPSFSPSSFNLHKLSFHPSGFVHSTDRDRQRRKSGVRGPSFEDMVLPYDCAVFVPCDPSRLPEHSAGKGFKAVVALPAAVRPFYITFSIISASEPPAAVQGPYIPHPLNFVFPGKRFGVALTMWPVQSRDETFIPTWPPFPFFLLRTAA